jgi:Uma2 family endonuclease
MSKYRWHTNAVSMLIFLLQQTFGPRRVNPESPIRLSLDDASINRPEPDIFVLGPEFRDTADRELPRPGDILMVIEVSGSTLAFDLTVKKNLYARAGIPEYWIADLEARRFLVFREPVDGAYRLALACEMGDAIAPLAAPDRLIAPSDVFHNQN